MFWAFLSSRLRTWLLLAVVLPLGGRLLEAVGGRVSDRSPRAARTLTGTGRRMQDPRGKRARRSRQPAA